MKDCTTCKHEKYCKRTEEICVRAYTAKGQSCYADCNNCANGQISLGHYTGSSIDCNLGKSNEKNDCTSFRKASWFYIMNHLMDWTP